MSTLYQILGLSPCASEAQIKMDLDMDKRRALVHEAVREILSRFPPKK